MREERAEGGGLTTVMVTERVGRFGTLNSTQAFFVFRFCQYNTRLSVGARMTKRKDLLSMA